MSRIRFAAALAVVICLASAAVASAATGPKATLRGTTKVTFSSTVASALRSAGVTVSSLSPATGASHTGSSSSANSSFSFPVGGGAVRSNPFTGIVYTSGGLTLSKGKASASVHHLVVFLNRNGSLNLDTLRSQGRKRVCGHVYEQHRRVCVEAPVYKFVPIAEASAVSKRGTTASGTVKLTAYLARIIDTLTGSTSAHAGEALGTITVSAIRS